MTLRRRLAVAAALFLLTGVAFEGVRHCAFVAFDDSIYVYRNPYVAQGLTAPGVRWAFGADLLFESPHADYWMPLTILSRMVDVELFGLDPAGHHAMNALFHALNAVLVFLMLEGLTGARGRSAFAAAVFAVHPLTVESVAWVTERKNVLSGLFWVLAIMSYRRHAQTGDRRAYVAAVVLMGVGLMTKPTLVVLPLVLLALDWWPLGRLRDGIRRSLAAILAEKVPFVGLAAASSAITLLSLSGGGHLTSVETVPLTSRIANASWSLLVYGRQVLWPASLAVLYPHPRAGLLSGRTALAVLAVGLIAWLAARSMRSRPWVLTGLAWSFLPLVPVLGVIQSGQQSHADRFMYVPLMGVGILLAWGAHDLSQVSISARAALPWAAAAVLLAWIVLTRMQVEHWRSTVTLFSHAVRVTKDNALAHHNLASALALDGDRRGAEWHYREALRVRPAYAQARSALGLLLMGEGRLSEALEQHQEALRLEPRSADAHFNTGLVLARMGRPTQATTRYAEAVRLNPSLAAAHYNWGNLLAAESRWPEAEARFLEAARLEPGNLDALNNLALAIGLQGRWQRAAEVLRGVVDLDPGQVRARVNLGRALRELGRLDEARAQWQEALARQPDHAAAAEAREELSRSRMSGPLDTVRPPR